MYTRWLRIFIYDRLGLETSVWYLEGAGIRHFYIKIRKLTASPPQIIVCHLRNEWLPRNIVAAPRAASMSALRVRKHKREGGRVRTHAEIVRRIYIILSAQWTERYSSTSSPRILLPTDTVTSKTT